MLELRAATSLARLLRLRGAHAASRNILTPLCRWFTDFDSADLKDAKAQLEELSKD